VGEHRVTRLIRAEAIHANTIQPWGATTDSPSSHPTAPNTFNRQSTVPRPTAYRPETSCMSGPRGELAVSGRSAGPLLAHGHCLCDGKPAHRDADHGARTATALGWTVALLGSRITVCRPLYRELLARHGVTVSMSRRGIAGTMRSSRASFIRQNRARVSLMIYYPVRIEAEDLRVAKCSIIGPPRSLASPPSSR
jgi:hypothetical protein